jgi:hypothetical protein
LNSYLLPGKIILKVKRDFYDPYLWVASRITTLKNVAEKLGVDIKDIV